MLEVSYRTHWFRSMQWKLEGTEMPENANDPNITRYSDSIFFKALTAQYFHQTVI